MQPWTAHLGPGPSVPDLIRALGDLTDDGTIRRPACLWGSWYGGGAVVAHSPIRVLDEGVDPIDLIDTSEGVGGAEDQTMIGGGWIGSFGFDREQAMLGFYDHLVRQSPEGDWIFETLGLPGREAQMRSELDRWRDLVRSVSRLEPLRSLSLSKGRSRSLSRLDPLRSLSLSKGQWSVGTVDSVRPSAGVRDDYLESVERAVGHIHRGDFYQMNLCTRLTGSFEGSPAQLFADVADALRPVYGGFLTDDSRSLIGLSPELFLRVREGVVTTAPIKGTAPRLQGETDSPQLRASAKDAAENIMIVDLMRNDLSRVCRPGTVRVEGLLDVQPHPGVWHLVSTIRGELEDGVTVGSLLRATFPPGSVTGAPKSSALTGIAELEPVPRGAYTGAYGMISPLTGTELSVLIRSFEIEGDRMELGVGGGITVDSVPMLEWRECLHKAAPLIHAAGATLASALVPQPAEALPEHHRSGVFETMLAVDGEALRATEHLARLERSCRELYHLGLPDGLPERIAAEAGRGRRAVRVGVAPGERPDGSQCLQVQVIGGDIGARTVATDLAVLRRPGTLWRHKWIDREILGGAEEQVGNAAFDRTTLPLFAADDGTLLETSRGNLFLATDDGDLVTPPLRDDLLPGVTRRALLDLADRTGRRVRIARFTLDDLLQARAVFWTSSLSGAVAVERVDGIDLRADPELLAALNRGLGFA